MTVRECRICESTHVVPVLDKRIERRTRPGNCYRQYCFGCSSWLPMTSSSHFETSTEPHVLPVGGDPDDPNSIIPLNDYDYSRELGELVDDVVRARYPADHEGATAPAVPVGDGGLVEDDAAGVVQVDELDANVPPAGAVPSLVDDDEHDEPSDDEHDNTFDCPACGARQSGYPESCNDCEAEYDW